MATQNYVVSVYDANGRPVRASSQNMLPKFGAELQIGNVVLTEAAGNLNMGGATLQNIGTATLGTDAVSLAQMVSYIDANVGGLEMQDSVLDILSTPPGTPGEKDRYIVGETATDAWLGKEAQVAEWRTSAWVFTVPTTGFFVSVDAESDGMYLYTEGSGWVKKSWENSTASYGLEKVGADIRVKLEATNPGLLVTVGGELGLKVKALSGLVVGADGLALSADTNTFEFDAEGKLAVKDDGISFDMLAAAIAGNGLQMGTASLEVKAGEDIVVDANGVHYQYSELYANTTGAEIAALRVVFVNTDGEVEVASADGELELDHDSLFRKVLGVTEAAIADTASGLVTIREGRIITVTGATFTVGAAVYLGVDGVITATTPVTAGHEVVRLGTAVSATGLYFAPSYEAKLS